MTDLYSMLTPEEAAYHDALVVIAEKFGPFDQGSGSIWVGYQSAAQNDKADIGVKCSNCSFHYETPNGMGCKIVSFLVEPEAYCRLAAIPDGMVNVTMGDDEMTEKAEAAKQSPCWDGYVQRGMKPGKDGQPVPNCVPAEKVTKAEETYSPNDGMKAAARRALRWKEEGKATGAGTPVGWGRASDIVAGRSMSLSTVNRMYSFFSRHEVDKKGKDFNNTANPSNGRIMWEAWGGDAGFAWSRAIVERNKAKKVWQNSPFSK
jgi:hypothetical protein